MVYQLPLEEQEELIDHFTDHIFQCAEKVPYDCPDLTLQLSQFDCAIYASDIVQKLMERSKAATDFENLVKKCTTYLTAACQALPKKLRSFAAMPLPMDLV
jgi:hypothetical protein